MKDTCKGSAKFSEFNLGNFFDLLFRRTGAVKELSTNLATLTLCWAGQRTKASPIFLASWKAIYLKERV